MKQKELTKQIYAHKAFSDPELRKMIDAESDYTLYKKPKLRKA